MNATNDGVNPRLNRNGKIALAPKNDITKELEIILETHMYDDTNYEVWYFDDEEEI